MAPLFRSESEEGGSILRCEEPLIPRPRLNSLVILYGSDRIRTGSYVLLAAESERRLRAKLLNYMAVGTLLWIVYPETQEVEIYAPGQPMKIVGIDGTLDGGDVLPGFKLAVKEIFVS